MSRHRRGLEEIAWDPSLIGLRGVRKVVLEMPVFKKKRVLTDIDLFFDTHSGLFIAEYKGGERRKQHKAMKQLKLGRAYVEREFGERPRCLYVYGPTYLTREVFS